MRGGRRYCRNSLPPSHNPSTVHHPKTHHCQQPLPPWSNMTSSTAERQRNEQICRTGRQKDHWKLTFQTTVTTAQTHTSCTAFSAASLTCHSNILCLPIKSQIAQYQYSTWWPSAEVLFYTPRLGVTVAWTSLHITLIHSSKTTLHAHTYQPHSLSPHI